jgi:hypothetical protein
LLSPNRSGNSRAMIAANGQCPQGHRTANGGGKTPCYAERDLDGPVPGGVGTATPCAGGNPRELSEPTRVIELLFNKMEGIWQERTQESYHPRNQSVTGILGVIFEEICTDTIPCPIKDLGPRETKRRGSASYISYFQQDSQDMTKARTQR